MKKSMPAMTELEPRNAHLQKRSVENKANLNIHAVLSPKRRRYKKGTRDVKHKRIEERVQGGIPFHAIIKQQNISTCQAIPCILLASVWSEGTILAVILCIYFCVGLQEIVFPSAYRFFLTKEKRTRVVLIQGSSS